jgi:uncharacterized protein with NAD-binding domain and iron-sulfur cluster
METTNHQPQKVAILGGGVSSITTAMELTEDPKWKEKYDITVYQMGWRLGGKGASGRNRELGDRIEEHGLHLWFGFYDNAFDLMQRCYKANDRPLDKPLAIWQEAFKPYDLVVLEELVENKWEHWPIKFPQNKQMPGTLDPVPTVWEYIGLALSHLHGIYEVNKEFLGNPEGNKKSSADKKKDAGGCLSVLLGGIDLISGQKGQPSKEHHTLFEGLEEWWGKIEHDVESIGLDIGGSLIYAALRMVESTKDSHHSGHHNILLTFIERILKWLWGKIEQDIEENTTARHLWIALDFALSNMRGMIKDNVITEGFDVINNIDYRDWIKAHGASQITLDSAPVQAVYGLVFGGYKYYSFEAGTALRGALRMALTYRGAIYYRMQAGMGDTIFGPMYEVLKKRGVKFEFFHKVLNLNLNTDTKTIDSIQIGVQATLNNGAKEYNPLYSVRNLPCWPNTPLYEQLEQGDELKREGIDLESYWSPWKNVQEKTLVRGKDYDIIVQGISIGALPVIAKELVDFSADWRKMVKMVTATETQAFQLWLSPDLSGLGWPLWMQGTPLSGTYKEPFDTWADMSDLIIRETWPNNSYPNNIAYVCGPVERKGPFNWDFNDHSVPEKAMELVKKNTLDYLQTLSHHLWPNTSPEDAQANFNWDLLIDPSGQKGQARFDQQFFRMNIDPSELYVLSETNSSANRLKTAENGFNDFYITGDWIDNGFNAGCVEAAVIAGKQTARAILGSDFEIPGEKDRI